MFNPECWPYLTTAFAGVELNRGKGSKAGMDGGG
jgi:hypothetical protein